MGTRVSRLAGILLSLQALVSAQSPANQMVRFHTNLGDIDVILLSSSAPKTVANFLNYVNRGAFNNSLVHRSVSKFIWQGGGFQYQSGNFTTIPQDAPVVNEYSVSNTRGTLAMAKLDGDPNSATNQWFFNLADNSQNLNNQNGGFTVFGRVASAASLAVMDKIAAVPVPNPGPLSSPFDQLPLINYSGGTVQESNLVIVSSITVMDAPPGPIILDGQIVTAAGYGGYSAAAPGSWIEISGANLSTETRTWAARDFVNDRAPVTLESVSVTVNGRPAYIYYVSPTQVNVQIPSNVPNGISAPVVLTFNGQSSAPVNLAIQSSAAGLLAPPTFNVAGKQYPVAIHASGGQFVSNGSITGIPAAPAIRGETLVFYGIGFGSVNPNTIPVAGQVVRGTATLATPVQFRIGDSEAQVRFAGLVPEAVGLYQFNIVVPADAPSGDAPLRVTFGSETLGQTLYVPVQPR